jgi:signal transduction histidine kinase
MDVRGTTLRMILVELAGLGYLFWVAASPGLLQWILALAAFGSGVLARNRPLLNFTGQAALFVVALLVLDDQTINAVGAAWGLLEVTARSSRTPRWWVAGVFTTLYAAVTLPGPAEGIMPRVYKVLLTAGVPLLTGLVIRTTAERDRHAARQAQEEQRRRESELRAARADERGAIARELHDVVAHHVASMVLRVGVARHVLPDLDPRAGEIFDDVHATGTTVLADLRRLVEVLRGPGGVRDDASLAAIEPSALPAALDGAVETARRSGLVVDADLSGGLAGLDAVRGLAVLRLTQEALTNVAKHAGTTARARLVVAITGDDVSWEVSDDGGGVDAPVRVAPEGGGHGLVGMRERVSVLGGTLEAGPHGAGWRVRTRLPGAAS